MIDEGSGTRAPTLTDDAARRVVLRALQLQADAGDVRIADLREAAAEIGVTGPHFESALREELELTGGGSALPCRTTFRTAASAGVLIGAIAAGSTLLPHFLLPVRLLTFGVLMMISGGLALRHRWIHNPEGFQVSNAALWGGFCASFALIAPLSGFSLSIVGWIGDFVLFWGFTALAGMIMTRVRRESSKSNVTPPAGPLMRIRGILARALRWVSDRLEPCVRFTAARRAELICRVADEATSGA